VAPGDVLIVPKAELPAAYVAIDHTLISRPIIWKMSTNFLVAVILYDYNG